MTLSARNVVHKHCRDEFTLPCARFANERRCVSVLLGWDPPGSANLSHLPHPTHGLMASFKLPPLVDSAHLKRSIQDGATNERGPPPPAFIPMDFSCLRCLSRTNPHTVFRWGRYMTSMWRQRLVDTRATPGIIHTRCERELVEWHGVQLRETSHCRTWGCKRTQP
jgi:hypothetical protein